MTIIKSSKKCTFTKGHLISKCLSGVFNFPKKRTKTIRLEVLFRSFFGRIEDSKKDISKLTDFYKLEKSISYLGQF